MNKRVLGRTGLEISELSLGGLFVSSFGAQFEQSKQAALHALELGVNYIDTAPTYFDSEEVLGKALENVDTPFYLSTKIGGRLDPFLPQDPDCLRRSVEDSLIRLKRDRVDILMVHEPDRPMMYDWWTDEAYNGPILDLLEQLKAEGIVRFTGLGSTTAYHIEPIIRTGRFDILLTALNYSLLFREASHYALPAAHEHNMGIVIGSPLQMGAFSPANEDEVRRGPSWMSPMRQQQFFALYDYARQIDIALPELALRFVLSDPRVSCALMGARSPAEVEQNVAAVDRGPLSGEILAKLDEIAAIVPFRPCEEPFVLPLGRDYQGLGLYRRLPNTYNALRKGNI